MLILCYFLSMQIYNFYFFWQNILKKHLNFYLHAIIPLICFIFVPMINVIIIGGGNVAWHLAQQFSKSKTINLVQIYNRNLLSINDLSSLTTITDDIAQLKLADVYFIAIADNALPNFLCNIPNKNALIVHTSGNTSINVLENFNRIGVFYPLQTLTKFDEINFNTIPILIEAKYEEDLIILRNIAAELSEYVKNINSDERKKIHLAAVFVNNFVNHLYTIGYQLLEENNINPLILNPLIFETAQKLDKSHPINIQTGPAKRKDEITIASHIALLNDLHLKNVYKLITDSISKKYE